MNVGWWIKVLDANTQEKDDGDGLTVSGLLGGYFGGEKRFMIRGENGKG